MMDVEASETCWATQKRQVINLWNCCILLVNLFELPVILDKFIKIEFSGQIFEKYCNIKFHKNPSSGSRFFLIRADLWKEGRKGKETEGHDKANSPFSQFCERAQKAVRFAHIFFARVSYNSHKKRR
jgi:hypothetical protein